MRRLEGESGSTGGGAALVHPSPELAAIVGRGTLTRADIISRVWDYIKAHDLQDPNDKRRIIADPALARVLGTESTTIFDINRLIAAHIR